MTKALILAALAFGCTEPRRGSPGVPPAEPTSAAEPLEPPRTQRSEGGAIPSDPGAATPAVATPTAPVSPETRVAIGALETHPEPPATAATPAARAEAATADDALTLVLIAPDGTPLPQTDGRPRTDSAGLRLRLEALVDAIARDEPALALPAFFPSSAYEQVKAIADPARDWRERLVRAFTRDVHEYHQKLGPDAASAQLASLIVNERAVRWMPPGAEGNRVGYYRVTRSRLRLHLAGGTERELELTSLISWRGAWYVVHLHGFS